MSKTDRILTAMGCNNLASMRKLVDKSNVNERDEDGFTLAMNAAMDGDSDPRILELLVERGADVNAVDPDRAYTALHFAARDHGAEAVRILLKAGADIDAVESFGKNTPLHLSLQGQCNLEVVQALLAYGADPKRKNREGDAPLAMARFADDPDLLALLKEYAAKGKAPQRARQAKGSVKAGKPKRAKKARTASRREPRWMRQHRKLWKSLVPARGPAATLQGELIRLTGKLSDEAYRNGNRNWSKGHERAWKFVGRSLHDPEVFSKDEIAEIDRHVGWIIKHIDLLPLDGDPSPYDALCQKAVEWCKIHREPIAFNPNKSTYAF